MCDRSALDEALKELVGWSDYAALRDRREEAAAPHVQKIAEKYGRPEIQVWTRFWLLVGFFGRTTRIGEEPTVGDDGRLKKGKYGSRRLMAGVQR